MDQNTLMILIGVVLAVLVLAGVAVAFTRSRKAKSIEQPETLPLEKISEHDEAVGTELESQEPAAPETPVVETPEA